jgi:hypothetical protein
MEGTMAATIMAITMDMIMEVITDRIMAIRIMEF